MWFQMLLCKLDINSRLRELGFSKQEISHIMSGITRKRYYRTWGTCQHCGGKVVGKFSYVNARPPGSATAVDAKTRIHEGLFCINCGVEFSCHYRVNVGDHLNETDFNFFRYTGFATHEFSIRNDGQSRNFFDLLREEANIPETFMLELLIGEREWLRQRLGEVEEQISALEGAEDVLAELKALEQPQLAATNE